MMRDQSKSSPTLYDFELEIKGLSESIFDTINSRRISLTIIRSFGPDDVKSDIIINKTKLNTAIHNIIWYTWSQEETLRVQNNTVVLCIKYEINYSAVFTGDSLIEQII